MSALPEPTYDHATLLDLAESGARHASASLQALAGGNVEVIAASSWNDPHGAASALGTRADAATVHVGRLAITGPPNGTAWVLIPDAFVRRLLEQFGSEDPDGSMALSIAAEVANIVTGAYVIEAANLWGVDLDPMPAQLSVGTRTTQGELDAALTGNEHAFAVGCDLADSDDSYGLSVVVVLDGVEGGS